MPKDPEPPADPASSRPAASRIVLTFPGPDAATASVQAENVTLGQVYAAAWFLDAWARELRQGDLVKSSLAGGLTPDLAAIAQSVMAGRGRPNGGPQ